MSEIRIYTMTGQMIGLKDEAIAKDKPVREVAAIIFRDGFHAENDQGGTIFRVARVDFTEGTFSGLVVAKH